MRMIDPTDLRDGEPVPLEVAYAALSLAGRELGSGPARAADVLLPAGEQRLLNLHVHQANAGRIALGITLGLIMAGDPHTLEGLRAISDVWRRTHSGGSEAASDQGDT